MTVARRYHLRKDEVQKLAKSLGEELKEMRDSLVEGEVEVLELTGGERAVTVKGKPALLLSGETPTPLLSSVHLAKLKRVVVDMGAVPHVANGADVMAPGVTSADEDIETGTLVVIADERHGEPLAVGRALVPGREVKGPSGKVVKNLHHVGDKIWNLLRGAE